MESGTNKIYCKICDGDTKLVFTAKLLGKYDVSYFKCNTCGYLATENPYWLDEAYKNPINTSDTGILMRNDFFTRVVSVIIYFFFDKNSSFLDYAGGYGIFTRRMRDVGFNFFWHDDFCENILAKEFEYKTSSSAKPELLTAFEVFEHFTNPLAEVKKMIEHSDNIIFSTVLLPENIPGKDWWYYGFNHGQHVSFYSTNTIKFIAEQFKLNFYFFDNYFLLTRKKINPLFLKLAVKLSRFGLFFYVKRKMKSKTMEDHDLLINKI